MKRIIVFLLVLVLISSFAGCTVNINTDSNKEDSKEVETVAATEDNVQTFSETEELIPQDTVNEDTQENKSEADGDIVDVDALKSIEESDTCKVKVTKKEIQEDAVSGLSMAGHDLFILSLTNNDSGNVSEVEVYLLAYDDNNVAQTIKTGTYSIGNGEKYVKCYVTNEDTVIKPGETSEMAIKTTKGDISGLRCIVASYKMNGKTIENDTALDWYKHAYQGKNTTLE